MKAFGITSIFILSFIFAGFAQPEESSEKMPPAELAMMNRFTFSIQGDVASADIMLCTKIIDKWKFGVGGRAGYSLNLMLINEKGFNMREHMIYYVFLRNDLTKFFSMDLGFRGGYATVFDNNPKHGFSHSNVTAAYFNPMIGTHKLKIGSSIVVGTINGTFNIYIDPISVRYSFWF